MISTWMSNCRQIGKSSRYIADHLGQLSLAIPLWVGTTGTTSTTKSYSVNRHTTQCTSPVAVYYSHELVVLQTCSELVYG